MKKFYCKMCGKLITKNKYCSVACYRLYWKKNNPNYKHQYYILNKQTYLQRSSEWYKLHSDQKNKLNLKWRKSHPHKAILYSKRYKIKYPDVVKRGAKNGGKLIDKN